VDDGGDMTSRLGDLAALVAPFAVGGLGAIPTVKAIPTWYRVLEKPRWNPPDRVFGPVWTALYGLMGIALVLVRQERGTAASNWAASNRAASDRAQALFGLQLALNLAWSFVFFGGRSVRGGLVVILLLWLSIVATIGGFARVRPAAATLLLPYLGWVTFASILNADIARRNAV
jgi:translocator protein